jgi:hypothetical protein
MVRTKSEVIIANLLHEREIDALIFQRAPQPFDEDVVEEPAAPVHRDPPPGIDRAPSERL